MGKGPRHHGNPGLPGWGWRRVTGMGLARSYQDGGGIGGKGSRHHGNPGLPGWGWPGVTGMGVARGYRDGGGPLRELQQHIQRIRVYGLLLRPAQASGLQNLAKSQAPFRFFSGSKVGKLRNKHNHIVMYSRGPLYLGVSWNWQLIRVALLLMASNTGNSHYYDLSL